MFDVGDVIDGKYRVDGVCSDTGGMGTILFVKPLKGAPQFKVVLKYCKDSNEEQLKRFRREVRLLASFKNNSKVIRIVDQNPDHDPPYFVMKHYPDGDLSKQTPKLQGSFEAQEQTFLQMMIVSKSCTPETSSIEISSLRTSWLTEIRSSFRISA